MKKYERRRDNKLSSSRIRSPSRASDEHHCGIGDEEVYLRRIEVDLAAGPRVCLQEEGGDRARRRCGRRGRICLVAHDGTTHDLHRSQRRWKVCSHDGRTEIGVRLLGEKLEDSQDRRSVRERRNAVEMARACFRNGVGDDSFVVRKRKAAEEVKARKADDEKPTEEVLSAQCSHRKAEAGAEKAESFVRKKEPQDVDGEVVRDVAGEGEDSVQEDPCREGDWPPQPPAPGEKRNVRHREVDDAQQDEGCADDREDNCENRMVEEVEQDHQKVAEPQRVRDRGRLEMLVRVRATAASRHGRVRELRQFPDVRLFLEASIHAPKPFTSQGRRTHRQRRQHQFHLHQNRRGTTRLDVKKQPDHPDDPQPLPHP